MEYMGVGKDGGLNEDQIMQRSHSGRCHQARGPYNKVLVIEHKEAAEVICFSAVE